MKPSKTIPMAEVVRQSLNEGQQPFFQVTSDSMSPLIKKGDDIQIAHQEIDRLAIGDIVVVDDEAGLLVHRLLLLFSHHGVRHLLLRGDRLKSCDPPYPVSQIVGRVIARRRKNKVLDLTRGTGRSLNIGLYKLTSLANPPPTSPPDPSTSMHYPTESSKESSSILNRIRNRFLLFVATTLTSLVDLAIRN